MQRMPLTPLKRNGASRPVSVSVSSLASVTGQLALFRYKVSANRTGASGWAVNTVKQNLQLIH